VSAPCIVRSVSRIHPGKADAYRPEPDEVLTEWLSRVSRAVQFSLHPVHWGGFTRFQATSAA
jgi:hypothetical protein